MRGKEREECEVGKKNVERCRGGWRGTDEEGEIETERERLEGGGRRKW